MAVVDVQAPDARVARDAEGYYQLKPTEKAGNPFEKARHTCFPVAVFAVCLTRCSPCS